MEIILREHLFMFKGFFRSSISSFFKFFLHFSPSKENDKITESMFLDFPKSTTQNKDHNFEDCNERRDFPTTVTSFSYSFYKFESYTQHKTHKHTHWNTQPGIFNFCVYVIK